jgi:hypothetical protein
MFVLLFSKGHRDCSNCKRDLGVIEPPSELLSHFSFFVRPEVCKIGAIFWIVEERIYLSAENRARIIWQSGVRVTYLCRRHLGAVPAS